MHAKIKYNGIVAYTLLNIHKEIHKFLQVLKEMHTEKAGSFFCLTVKIIIIIIILDIFKVA